MERGRLEGSAPPAMRVQRPHPVSDVVSRPRLLELLERHTGWRLAVVCAPEGFGKTTLLAEWAATAEKPVAWLSLAAVDADPVVLWADIVEALGHAVPGFRAGGAPSPETIAAALGARRSPIALVLDGYEAIADTPSNESVGRLVAAAPPTLQLVLSGRVDPAFALPEPGDLLEIRTADLRMTDVEAAELLHRAAGGSLAVREVLRQIERCEGRPAALRLVASSPADTRDVAEAVREIVRSWRCGVDAGEQARVLAWIERLPGEVVDRDPSLGIVRAWLLLLEGRREESKASLDAARDASAGEQRSAVDRDAALLLGAVAWDDVGSALAAAEQARRSERSGTRRSLAAWALGSASWWSGDLDRASHELADALDGTLLVRCAAQAVLSRIELERGREDLAVALARTADRALRDRGLANLPEMGMVASAVGAVDAARSPGSGALAQLERGVRLRRAWGSPLETADALIVAAPAAAAVVGRRQAATMLGEARRLVAACPDPGVLADRLARAERIALPRPDRLRPDPVLSESELEVLRLLGDGLSTREIGAELYLSFNTVHSRTRAIYRKLGVSTRHEAVARAHELGVR